MEDNVPARRFDLALSGGGIRSATFSLGVLQALAERGWLHRIRTLSTVSGGGYIGAFLCQLAGRFAEPNTAAVDRSTWRETIWKRAADVLLTPTTRDITLEKKPALNPLQWLRENSRYLAPSGSSDMAGGLAYYLRGLLGLHFDLAVMLMLFGVLNLALMAVTDHLWQVIWPDSTARSALMHWLEQPPGRADATGARTNASLEWILSGWWLAAAALGAVMLAVGIAYWFTTRPTALDESEIVDARRRIVAHMPVFGGFAVLAANVSWLLWAYEKHSPQLWAARFVFFITALALLVSWASWSWKLGKTDDTLSGRQLRVDTQRRRLTWLLTRFLQATALISALAMIDTVALSLTQYRLTHGRWLPWAVPAAGYAAVLAAAWKWLVGKESKEQTPSRWTRFLHIGLLVLALAVAACLMVFYQMMAYLLAAPKDGSFAGPLHLIWPHLGGAIALLITLVGCIHFSPGFLNFSSFHNLYAARLKRAYLGATNPARLQKLARSASSNEDRTNAFVDEVMAGDEPLDVKRYMAMNRLLGIEHVVNVTVNQRVSTTSPTLAQDRQGVPMCLDQRGAYVAAANSMRIGWKTLSNSPLTLAQWIAISGAAFSVGVGKETRIGYALMAFLANVRTAYWWPAPDKPQRNWLEGAWSYLWDEMRCQFRGTEARYWYLSDGGHFDNTAVYELLRRRAPLVFASDNGADPDYLFEDLAHLLRRIRIDMGAEAVIRSAGELAAFGHSFDEFGTAAEFHQARQAGTVMPFAVWVEVYFAPEKRGTTERSDRPDSIIVFLKPGLPGALPLDVLHYAQTNSKFPQETTADQFFDEAQWESYRKLGHLLATRLLKQGVLEAAAKRLCVP